MKKVYEFDVVILGGGPAGLSAGIYSSRANLKTAIIDVSMFGGQPSNYLELENYPAFPLINGYELMEKFEEHLDKFGVDKFPMQEITSVDLISNPKIVETTENIFQAKSVIIACGAKPKKLEVRGEEEYLGRGVSYCAVCDGAFYKDKIVTVVGGGNTAVEEGIYLTKFAKKVNIVHRRNQLRADKIIQERAFNNDKIEFIYDSKVKEIQGNDVVENLVIENTKTGEISNLKTDGVFVFVGFTPNVSEINGQINQDMKGFIITDETMKTSVDGVYAVGDIRNTPLRQVITATSDGAIGAVYASKYVEAMAEVVV
jgi:thioredoxin reductase (NADPH)